MNTFCLRLDYYLLVNAPVQRLFWTSYGSCELTPICTASLNILSKSGNSCWFVSHRLEDQSVLWGFALVRVACFSSFRRTSKDPGLFDNKSPPFACDVRIVFPNYTTFWDWGVNKNVRSVCWTVTLPLAICWRCVSQCHRQHTLSIQ